MTNTFEHSRLSSRELTAAELDQVSGGRRTFNPQPDPPGIKQDAPASPTAAMYPPDPY